MANKNTFDKDPYKQRKLERLMTIITIMVVNWSYVMPVAVLECMI